MEGPEQSQEEVRGSVTTPIPQFGFRVWAEKKLTILESFLGKRQPEGT